MSEEKTILLKVTLDTADLKKSSEEASKKLEELKIKQAILKGENKQGTVEYAKLNAEIRQQTKVLNDTAKALVINEKLNKTNKGSINEMREALALGTTAYNALSQEQRENSTIGKQLQASNKAISDSLKEQEGAIGDTRRNVGNYGTSLQDLKKQLRDLKGEMVGLDAGSEEYQQASEKAGKLGDKIKEVNENVKASSGGTGFEKLSNNLGLVQDDLMNLDFAGVSEKMKQMAVISKGMTFKEVVGGLKNMGSALLSLGKAILANPMFLMVGAIVAIVGALKLWSDHINEKQLKAQEKHTKSIRDNISAMQDQRDTAREISELQIRRAELEGASTEKLNKMKMKSLKDFQNDEVAQFRKNLKDITNITKQKNSTDNEERVKNYQETLDALYASNKELVKAMDKHEEQVKTLRAEGNKEILDKQKENSDKVLKAQEETNNKRAELQKRLNDLLLDNEDSSNDLRRQKLEANFKFELDNAEGNADEILEIQKRKVNALNSLDEEQKADDLKRAKSNYEESIKDLKLGGALQLAEKRKYDLQIKDIESKYKIETEQRTEEYKKLDKDLNAQKVLNAKKTDQEIRLIDAETKHLQATNEADKLATFKELQAERIKVIQENADAEIATGKKTKEEIELIEKKAGQESLKINQEVYTAKKVTKENELTDEQKKLQQQTTITLNSAVQLTDALSQITQNRIANELNEEQNKNDEKQNLLTQQLDAGLITDKDYKVKKDALDKEFKAKESKLKKEAFEKDKQANIIKAIMNTAVSVTASLANPPLAILAGVLGAVQVGLIASQPTPKFAKGGVFGGKSHSNGGTKGVFEDGTQIEVEKDESFFILNKRATPLINSLSNINQSTGGVPLMEKGGVMKFANGGMVANMITSQIDTQYTQQNAFLKAVKNMPNPIVSVSDISTAQMNVAVIENRSIF
jgi:hypothetical protein